MRIFLPTCSRNLCSHRNPSKFYTLLWKCSRHHDAVEVVIEFHSVSPTTSKGINPLDKKIFWPRSLISLLLPWSFVFFFTLPWKCLRHLDIWSSFSSIEKQTVRKQYIFFPDILFWDFALTKILCILVADSSDLDTGDKGMARVTRRSSHRRWSTCRSRLRWCTWSLKNPTLGWDCETRTLLPALTMALAMAGQRAAPGPSMATTM